MSIIVNLAAFLLFVFTNVIPDISRISCSEENNSCLVITEKEVFLSDLDLKTNKLLDVVPEELKSYHAIWVNNQIYFVEHFGGKVLQLINNNVTRIDNSYTHRSQLLAPLFEYNHKIYRFGGYGFFDARNFFTYFDTSSKEWEVLKTNSSIIPDGIFDSKHLLVGDDLFLLGGKKIDQNDRTSFINSSEIWRFNFKERKWYFIGQTNKFESLTMEITDFNVNGKLYFFKNQSLIEFDPNTLKFSIINNFPLIEKLSKDLPIWSNADKLQYLTTSYNEGTKLQLNHINLDLLKNKSDFTQIKGKISNYFKVIVFLLSLSIASTILFLRRKKASKKDSTNKEGLVIKFNNEYLLYEDRSLTIDEIEYELLKLFTNNTEVYTESIIDLFSAREVTFSQKLRLKDSLIEKVNIKLNVLFSSESDTRITQARSESDKRIRIYKLNVDIQEI